MTIKKKYNGINKRRKNFKKIIGIIVGALAIIAALSFFYVYSALQPLDKSSEKEIEIEIPMGSSIISIGEILEENGIIKNGTIFSYYTRLTGSGGFQAGIYQFSPSMSGQEVIEKLTSGPDAIYRLVIPEGMQVEEIAEIVEKTVGIKKEEFLEKVNDEEFLRKLQGKFPELLTDEIFQDGLRYALEGYLFPATYHFYQRDVTIEDIIVPMLQQTANVINQHREEMEEKGMTVHELLTMSSLIEKEATELADRKKIASVFYNRLEINMPLQTDPTVLYALGVHKSRVLYKHLTVDSPFNTYRYRGLPIGPIANSGMKSILAALEPDDTDYLFFLADRDGKNYFSRTYEEHLKLREEHITQRWAEEEAAQREAAEEAGAE